MATGINIPISYSPGSIDQILKDFDAIIQKADISDVFVKDQEKIRAQFATIGNTIKEQLASGKIDLTKINFTGLEKDIEDFARKVAFVLNEAFEKEVAPYAKKITEITDLIVVKQKELADLNEQAAKIGGDERGEFKQKYGINKMPTLDKGEAKRKLAAAEEELEGDKGNADLQKKVEMYRELLEMLSTEKERKKQINDQINKKELEILTLTNDKKKTQIELDKAQAKLGADQANYSQQLLDLNRLLIVAKENGIDLSEQQIKILKDQAEATDKATKAGRKEEKGLIARAGASFSYGLILTQLRKIYQQSLRTVLELDKAMTEAAIVTEMNRQEAYKLLGTYQQLARETGLATSEISGIVVEFLKQGRTMNEAMELAKVAAMSAKVAGINAREAVDYLTSAVNGFGLAANQAKDIADKFSAIAAASATDFEELAIAMSKVAPVAKVAGVGVDFMMGVLAKGLETTREAPENIGTAFKTIFARMREVTDIGKATEDGMSLNRVEKALESIGVPLRDVTGQFRNLEDVLIEVGDKWDTLTTIEQAYIATALAGTRQQPRLLAIFNDFARTKELIQISSDATGQLAFQHMEYMQGAEAALSQLKTAWEGFIMAFTDTGLVIDSIKIITDMLNGLVNFFEGMGNSAQRNAALIGLVGMALMALAPQYVSNIGLGLQDIAVKQQLKNSTKEVREEYEKLTLSIRKATGAQRDLLLEQRKQIITDNGVNMGKKALTKSILASAAATLKAMLITAAWTLLIAGAVLIITSIINAIKEANLSVEELSNRIQKNNKELNDLKTKEDNVNRLTKRFEELSRKVVKTSAELDELNRIAEELGSVTIGEKEFNIARTDIMGNIVFDKTTYENFLAEAALARQKLLQENIKYFETATTGNINKMESAFKNNPVLTSMARDIGYDFGVNFLNSMTSQGFSQANVSKAMDNLQRAMMRIQPTQFLEATNAQSVIDTFKAWTNNIWLNADQKNFGETILRSLIDDIPKTAEEAYKRIQDAFDAERTKAGENLFTGALKPVREGFVNDVYNAFTSIQFEFSEQQSQAFSQEMSILFLNASEMADRELKSLTTVTTKDILTANLNAYQQALRTIKGNTSLSQSEIDMRINLIKESMQDEAIIDMFLQAKDNRGRNIFNMDLIVSILESGTSLSELSSLVDNVRQKLSETALTTDQQTSSLTSYNQALVEAFGNNNYANAYRMINDIFGVGSQEAKIQINALSNALNLLSATTAATSLSEQGKSVQELLKLPEQIAKGDFSKYGELVSTFGFETVEKVLKGGTVVLDDFFTKNREKFETETQKAIENIQATYFAMNQDKTVLGDAEQEQIDQLQLMLLYYDKIAGVEQLRAATLKEVKDLVKETNDLYSLQDKLLKGGMSGNSKFMQMLDKAIDVSESNALGKLGDQLRDDISALNSLGRYVNGTFLKDANADQMLVDQGIANMMQTITELVDIQTAAYNRQAKTIEERYKTELDAIKSAHDEKWSEIDYNNKLVETEEKIIDARRQLMGLALSGGGRGEYEDAQKALEKLQQEREKLIETQMMDEAQKVLEQQRNDDLIKAQQEFTKAIEGYTQTIDGLRDFVAGNSTFIGGTGPGPKIIEGPLILSEKVANALETLKMETLLSGEKTGELINTNTILIEELASLSSIIESWKVGITRVGATADQSDSLGT